MDSEEEEILVDNGFVEATTRENKVHRTLQLIIAPLYLYNVGIFYLRFKQVEMIGASLSSNLVSVILAMTLFVPFVSYLLALLVAIPRILSGSYWKRFEKVGIRIVLLIYAVAAIVSTRTFIIEGRLHGIAPWDLF